MRDALFATGAAVWVVVGLVLVRRVLSAVRQCARLDVSGRWLIVTGSDSGFGRGVVEQLVARKARVIACCYTADGARAALEAGAVAAPQADLSDPAAVERLAREILETSGGEAWGVVHNAGVVLPGFVDYQPPSFFRTTMEVNFFGPVRLTQKLLPALKRSQGRVVFVSSVDGIVSLPGNAPYDASKFALEAFADALRAEVSFWGVEVSVINPSTMRTPLAMSFFEAHRKAWAEMLRLDPEGEWRVAWPAEWLEQYVSTNAKNLERIAQSPGHAIADIVHALTARRPRLRYLSGTLSRTLFYALWVGPEAWAHRFKTAMILPPPPRGAGTSGGPRKAALALGAAVLVAVGAAAALRAGPRDDAAPPRLHVTGVLHVNVNCSDFERSRAFYE